jgi:hypothetical protein
MIEFLNFSFVFSLGMVTLWLFYHSMASGRVRRSSPKPRAELLLEVFRDGSSFLKLPLNKSHYLIGRGPECDIPLRGMGIPLKVGALFQQDGAYLFKNFQSNSVMINNRPIHKEARPVCPGDEIRAYNFSIRIKEKVPLTPTLSRRGRGGN